MNPLPKLPSTGCFKDILAHVPSDASAAGVIGSAISVARLFAAHIDAVAAVEHSDARHGTADASASGLQTIVAFEDTAGAAAGTLLQFEAAAKQAGLSYGKRLIADHSDKVDRMLARASRLYDVSIIAQPDPATVNTAQPQAMLFDSGRPVILIPRAHRTGIALDRIGVCWDGGRYAARALHDAMPLLELAGCIDIIAINEPGARLEASAEALASYLARRRLNARVEQPKADHLGIYHAIMVAAAEAGTKLLVMGGYGHSKAGRFVLGGVTRDALKEMSLPTFMSF
ncbi:universal stress protein [Bradyrhizobium sp. Tv2a-2]|uniref:universal stress protein n=1 Tax=Bradyrhizobium sp. Tv2a-2 TaxID=113395 RepID=UPI000405CB15|nr:universal stress protein [Bradyrhizobium sp. Tv2a-2]